ncbi:hypothetical protein [Aeromonas jandaei]|uniref:hypothetical protein n=1 Tax=Aeromonas jandaei TaxID=650 RepID=UPI001C057268|nr:hypothetical protein [Aeromonas jandaei]QWL64733.1 hypothetical protein HQ398_20955 [Aeromonas jandaei]
MADNREQQEIPYDETPYPSLPYLSGWRAPLCRRAGAGCLGCSRHRRRNGARISGDYYSGSRVVAS